jgi:hypothetical protein
MMPVARQSLIRGLPRASDLSDVHRLSIVLPPPEPHTPG